MVQKKESEVLSFVQDPLSQDRFRGEQPRRRPLCDKDSSKLGNGEGGIRERGEGQVKKNGKRGGVPHQRDRITRSGEEELIRNVGKEKKRLGGWPSEKIGWTPPSKRKSTMLRGRGGGKGDRRIRHPRPKMTGLTNPSPQKKKKGGGGVCAHNLLFKRKKNLA